MSTFVSSDAWLLLALLYAKEPATRARIREVGDFINHAIFTDKELDEGLSRLLSVNYVVANEKTYHVSPEVLRWYESQSKGKKHTHVFKDMERVERYLGIKPRT